MKRKRGVLTRFRNLIDNLFDSSAAPVERGIIVNTVSQEQTYHYDRPDKVDYKLTRLLYRNRHQQYAFGAQLVKPIIDSNVSFIGRPVIRSTDDKTTIALEELKDSIPYAQVHKIAEREGTAFVWPQWLETGKINFVIIPNENIRQTYIEPITKEIIGYKIVEKFSYPRQDSETPYNCEITLQVYKNKVVRTITGDNTKINGTKTITNVFNVIPIVQFNNDKEPWENEGHSEIENIEPQLKLYHDITLEAMHAQKRDGHPKAKVKTKNAAKWVDNNFGAGTFNALKTGQAAISLQDRNLFICETGNGIEGDEDIQYVEANKATGDFNVISERTFTNMVEGAQTPEIIFGANMGTSLASVTEQRPAYIKKIQKKQLQYEEGWRSLIRMALTIKGYAIFDNYDIKLTFSWPTPDFSSDKEKADTLNVLTTSLTKLKVAHLMGDEEIHDTIKRFDIIQVKQDLKKHEADVEETADKMAERLKDEIAAKNLEMTKRIAEGDYDNTKKERDDDDAKEV